MTDQNELSGVVYQKMCVLCSLREFCHPSCNSLNYEAIRMCLERPDTVVAPDRPRELGHHTFQYPALLEMQLGERPVEMRAVLIDKAWRILKVRGLLPDPPPDCWAATVTVSVNGYIVRIYDKEVCFPWP